MRLVDIALAHLGVLGVVIYIVVIHTSPIWIGTKWGDVYAGVLALFATVGAFTVFSIIGRFFLK